MSLDKTNWSNEDKKQWTKLQREVIHTQGAYNAYYKWLDHYGDSNPSYQERFYWTYHSCDHIRPQQDAIRQKYQ
jgi:hypothetical protein